MSNPFVTFVTAVFSFFIFMVKQEWIKVCGNTIHEETKYDVSNNLMRRVAFKVYIGNKASMRNKNNTLAFLPLVQTKQKYSCNVTEVF